MREAARNLEFERAAALRDELWALRRLREELNAAPGEIPADVYAAAAEAGGTGGAPTGAPGARCSARLPGRTSSRPGPGAAHPAAR